MLNPFEAVADTQRHAASKAAERALERRMAKLVVKSEADAPMVVSEREKEQFEQSKQLGIYRKWLKQRRADLAEGPHGRDVAGLLQFIDSMTIESAPALVKLVQASAWLKATDERVRFEVLSIISAAIIRLRVRNGYPPFDDSLWDEPPTAFEVIRYELTGVAAAA